MSQGTSVLNSTRADRIRRRVPVQYGLSDAERSAYAQNVSEGGLRICTNDVLKVGTRLSLWIEFPEKTVFHRVEVVWAIRVPEHLRDSMVYGMGVSFVRQDPEWLAFFRLWRESVQTSR